MPVESKPEIVVTTKRTWLLMDSSKPEFESFIELNAGTHRLEMQPCPYGDEDMWLMLEGTQLGKPLHSWLGFQYRADDFQVIVEGFNPPISK